MLTPIAATPTSAARIDQPAPAVMVTSPPATATADPQGPMIQQPLDQFFTLLHPSVGKTL
jgi:hypothetical protein